MQLAYRAWPFCRRDTESRRDRGQRRGHQDLARARAQHDDVRVSEALVGGGDVGLAHAQCERGVGRRGWRAVSDELAIDEQPDVVVDRAERARYTHFFRRPRSQSSVPAPGA